MVSVYLIQAVVMTLYSVVLFALYLRVFYASGLKQKLKSEKGPRLSISLSEAMGGLLRPARVTPAEVLANFRGNALAGGLIGSIFLALFALDSGRVNGIWHDFALVDMFGRIGTIICGWLVLSYVVAVVSASFCASKLSRQRPIHVFNAMFAGFLLVFAAAIVTTCFTFADADTTYAYTPYLASLIIFEILCISGSFVSFYRFYEAVKFLRNSNIDRAIARMRRMAVLMSLFAVFGLSYQIYFLFNHGDRGEPHDPDSYRVGGQYALYLLAFVYTGCLLLIWENVPRQGGATDQEMTQISSNLSSNKTSGPSSSSQLPELEPCSSDQPAELP